MATIKTKIGTEESARKQRVEPTGGITATNTQKALEGLDTAKVPATRAINTTAPLAGGGTLAADLTITTSLAASSLAGNPTGVVAPLSAISLGSTLTFSGAALQTAALTGEVTAAANSFATTLSRTFSPTMTGNWTFNPTSGNAITINPLPNSLGQSIVSTQSSQTSGTSAGPILYNQFAINNQIGVTGAGSTNGLLNASTRAFSVALTDGATAGSNSIAGLFELRNTIGTSVGDRIALAASAYSTQANNGFLMGLNAFAQISGAAAVQNSLVAAGLEVGITSSASATSRMGLEITNIGTIQAGTFDAAIVVDNGTAGGQFKNFVAFASPTLTQAPIDTTGSLFIANQAMTVANIFSMANVTVTGNILSFPNASLSGAGQLALGAIGSTVGSARFANATSGTITVQPTTGALGSAVLSLPAVTDTLTANAAAQTLTNKTLTNPLIATVIGGSAAGSTLTLESTSGAGTTDAIIFQTASQVERARITTGGLFNIGGNLAPPTGSLLTVNNNAAVIPSAAAGLVSIASTDGNNAFMISVAAGVNKRAGANYYASRGTLASPTATQSGDFLGSNFAVGYGNAYMANGGAGFIMSAAEIYDATHAGAHFDIYTTPAATTAVAFAARVNASGGVSIGVSTDPAVGGLLVNGQGYWPNMATTASAANVFINTGSTPAGQLQRVTSSLIYKRDVEPLEQARALNVLRGGKPIWYRSKCASDNPKWSWYGLGAEDMAALDPRLVHFGYQDSDYEEFIVEDAGPNGPIKRKDRRLRVGAALKADSVQYERLTVHLITGWQSHEARIAALESAQPRVH